MKKIQFSIISPCYNEEKNIPILYGKIKKVLNNIKSNYEVIFVNDGSIDRTSFQLSVIAKKDKKVKVIEFVRNFGQTAAITAGLLKAKGSIIILIDSDLQNDPEDIPLLLKYIRQGYDVVSGWRKERKDNFLTKRLPSLVANKIISKIIGTNLHDYGCTLKAYRKEVLDNFNLYGEMHRLIPAYAVLNGAKIIEIRVRHHKRQFGRSHYNLWRTLKVIFDLLTIKFLNDFSTKPLYLFGSIGLLFFLTGFLIFIFVVLRVILFHGGWVSPLILLSGLIVILSFQFVLIGLLAELLVRIYFESRKKSPFIIKKTYNI